MSTDIRAQNVTVNKGTDVTLRFHLYQDDANWSPYTSSAGLEALLALRDADDVALAAITTTTFTQTIDADLDALKATGITFDTATRTNPVTGTSETVVRCLAPLSDTVLNRAPTQYTYTLRIYDNDDDIADAAQGRIILLESNAT